MTRLDAIIVTVPDADMIAPLVQAMHAFDFAYAVDVLLEAPDAATYVIACHKECRLGALVDKIYKLERKIEADNGQKRPIIGPYIYDRDHRELILSAAPDDICVLTDKESEIIDALLTASGAAVSRKDLLECVWGYGDAIDTHTLETHIYRLRQKMEPDPGQPVLILTEGDGYALSPEALVQG